MRQRTASPALARAVKPRDHAALETVAQACAYMLALPPAIAARNAWDHAAGLALAARARPTRAAIAALTDQLELALFVTYRSELSAAKTPPAPSIRRRGSRPEARRAWAAAG